MIIVVKMTEDIFGFVGYGTEYLTTDVATLNRTHSLKIPKRKSCELYSKHWQ